MANEKYVMMSNNPTGKRSFSLNRKEGTTIGNYSHAEGGSTTASGHYSHAEGCDTTARGNCSHAEGYGSVAQGQDSHAEGGTVNSSPVGSMTVTAVNNKVLTFENTTFTAWSQIIKNQSIISLNKNEMKMVISDFDSEAKTLTLLSTISIEVGDVVTIYPCGPTMALGKYSHAEGYNTISALDCSHAEGYYTKALGYYSHAEGYYTKALGNYSHAEGGSTTASGNFSHAEGGSTTASGYYSHAEGCETTAGGNRSHAEGGSTKALGNYSHAEGGSTTASGDFSHAEGGSTTASGYYSHAEGCETTAGGNRSHAEGGSTTASGDFSHAGGYFTIAEGKGSLAAGAGTVASADYSTAIGTGNDPQPDDLFEIGNGSVLDAQGNILPEESRTKSNALRVTKDGRVIAKTDVELENGTKLSEVPTKVSELTNDSKYTTETYVTTALNNKVVVAGKNTTYLKQARFIIARYTSAFGWGVSTPLFANKVDQIFISVNGSFAAANVVWDKTKGTITQSYVTMEVSMTLDSITYFF